MTSWETLQRRIEDTLAAVFGHGTREYHRYYPDALDPTPLIHLIPRGGAAHAGSLHC
jgi:hypothetical protein